MVDQMTEQQIDVLIEQHKKGNDQWLHTLGPEEAHGQGESGIKVRGSHSTLRP